MRMLGATLGMLLAMADGGGVATVPVPRTGNQPTEVTVIAERFKFTPDRLVVNQGDTVRLVVRSADGTHGIEIKKLDVDELVPKGGKPVTVEFVATEAGTFPITCSEYCGRGHERMKGVLEVRPAGGGSR